MSASSTTAGMGSTGVPTDASTMPPGTSAARARIGSSRSCGYGGGTKAIGGRLTGSRFGSLVALDARAAAVLGGVHGEVGATEQLAGAGIPVVRGRDANAHRDDQRLPTEVDRLRHRREQTFGDVHRLAVTVEVGEHGRELVAAESGDAVGRAQGLLQALPDGLEHPVADLVTEVVVHRLEAIEVEVQHREVRLMTADAGDGGLEPVEDQHAVREPGERVVQRAVTEE